MLESNFKMRPECLRNMKVSTLMMQRAAAKGMTLAEMSQIFCRPDDDDTEPSPLEKIVAKAQLQSEAPESPKPKGIRKNLSFNNLLTGSQPKRSRLMSQEVNLLEHLATDNGYNRGQDVEIQIEDLDAESQHSNQIEEVKVDPSAQQQSFGAACKQMAKPVWSRLNFSNEQQQQSSES